MEESLAARESTKPASGADGLEYFDRETDFYGVHADVRPEFTERYELIGGAIAAALAERGDDALALDVGCGRGHLTRELATHSPRTIAIDGSQAMLDATAERVGPQGLKRVELRHELLPLPPAFVEELAGSASLIVCSSVIEYVDRDLELLRQFRRMLRPDGTLLISFPNARSLYWIAQRRLRQNRFVSRTGSRHQAHQYTERDIKRFAQGVGLAVHRLDYFSMPLQRAVPRWVTARPRSLATLVLATMTPAP